MHTTKEDRDPTNRFLGLAQGHPEAVEKVMAGINTHRQKKNTVTVLANDTDIDRLARVGGLLTIGRRHEVGITTDGNGNVFIGTDEAVAHAAATGVPLLTVRIHRGFETLKAA